MAQRLLSAGSSNPPLALRLRRSQPGGTPLRRSRVWGEGDYFNLQEGEGFFWVSLSARSPDNFALLRFQAASKYNSQYHKLFKDIPTEESVLKGGWHGQGRGRGRWGAAHHLPCPPSLCPAVCSCALQRDILIQGRLYISPNWLCFYANLFGKDIKVTWGPAHPSPTGLIAQATPQPAYSLLHPKSLSKASDAKGSVAVPPPPITCGICPGKPNTGLL